MTVPPIAPPGLQHLPSGANPEEFNKPFVTTLLKRAACFSIFSVANPQQENAPRFVFPGLPIIRSVDVREVLHRFDVPGNREGLSCLASGTSVGERLARVGIRWVPIPDWYEPHPDREPPPWFLNPFDSQRFCMLGGRFDFDDVQGTGFRGFGTGRTFPATEQGAGCLRIGAVIDVLEGFGALRGLPATVVVNGVIRPPSQLALNLLVRVMDPHGRLRASSVPPLRTERSADALFLLVLGEPDPDRPVTLIRSPDGSRVVGSQVFERLRLVSVRSYCDRSGPRSRLDEGPWIGRLQAQLSFDPMRPGPSTPITTTDGVVVFADRRGRPFGTIAVNMVEGRAFRTPMPGAFMPVFRFAGFGPILGGGGAFAGAAGMMTMNAAISVFPRTLSNLYMFRIYDPCGRFRAALAEHCA